MKLGVVTTSFPRHRGDFAGHFVASLVELCRRAGHTVEVIAAGVPTAAREERAVRGYAPTELGAVAAPSLRVTRLPSPLFYSGGAADHLGARSAPSAAWFSARLCATTWRRARGWDAVMAHWLAPSALAALPSSGPLLALAHGSDVHLLAQTGLLPASVGLLLARRARLAFVSGDLAARARDMLPSWMRRPFDDATIVQPMGVDTAHFAAVRARSSPPHPRRYAVVLARLVPQKGVALALRALALLPQLDLIIAGEGPQRDVLAQLARPLGDRVRMIGPLDAAARDRLLAHAAVALLPSRRTAAGRGEGTPLCALEALACGIPVVAAAVGGLAELPGVRLVAGDDGVSHEAPALAQRWAAAIEEVLATPQPSIDMAPYDWHRVHGTLWQHWMGASGPTHAATLATLKPPRGAQAVTQSLQT